jgi:hypothetical protein
MPVEKGLIKQVVAGKKEIGRLFTAEQEEFLEAVGQARIDYDTLRTLGPLQAHRWKFESPACPWAITTELWKRADGSRLLEMSIKSPVVQAAVAIGGFMALLAELGAERDLEQQTKTRWALEYHAASLRDPAQAPTTALGGPSVPAPPLATEPAP